LVDNCGNAAADQVQIINVEDNTAPIITIPANITVNYNPSLCGTVVTYTVTALDNCSGAVTPLRTAGPASGAIFPLGTTTVTHTATDACGNTSSNSFTVTVNAAPTTSTLTVTPGTGQYSDLVTLKVVIANGASLCGGPNAATSTTFTINGQVMKHPTTLITNIPFVLNGNDLEAILTTPLLDYVLNSGVMSPGLKTVSAVINGIAPEFAVSQPANKSLTVTKEDARITYTGDLIKATASASTYSATVTLRANIMDITVPQTPSDPAFDPDAGDIRNAKVMFIDRDLNTPISGWLSVTSLINPSDSKIGTVSAPFTIGGLSSTTPSKQVTVGIIVNNGGYYYRNDPGDNVVVTVYLPSGDFITGGGYIIPTKSVGTKASDPGKKANFGFNVKFNKTGKNLQGNMNIIFRRTESDLIVHNYQIKANAMISLGVNVTNPNRQTAEYVSKTNLTDITNPLAPVSLGGNNYLYVKMIDNGEPGVNDSISFVVVNGNTDPTVLSNIIWSSNWVGSLTKMMNLGGGNLVVHSGFNSGTVATKTSMDTTIIPTTATPVKITLKPRDRRFNLGVKEFEVKTWPNPATQYFTARVESSNTNEQVVIKVFDITGKLIRTVTGAANSNIRFGEDFITGIYIIEVSQGNQRRQLKIMKQSD
jgi:hypothetical protein